MANMKRLQFSTVITALTFLLGNVSAQRPTNASVCDYYAQARYGANSSETQLKFIQNVVCLAFEGGTKLNNVSSEITGILRKGRFSNMDIDLLQYFNGSRASTNVNNAPIGINWLDQGGTTPLAAFLAGETQTLNLADTSNQYHLFTNFFVAFSRAFGCTLPPNPLPNTNGPVMLAYAHKFMNLEYHQLGYFINQLSLAASHFGVSAQDADTFRTTLNSRYNVRCAPAVSFNPSSPAQLLSLCQNPTCPLAVPVSDCAAYTNLTANGIASSKPTTVTSIAISTASGIDRTTSPTAAAAAAPSSGKLSTGGIAGVAIGGAAVLLAAIIALFYFLRKRKSRSSPPETPAPSSSWDQQNYGSTVHGSTYSPKNPHTSHYSTGPPPSEMENTMYQNFGDTHSPQTGSPDPTMRQTYQPYSGHTSEVWSQPPVEMRGSSPVPQNAGWREPQHHSIDMPMQGQEQQHWGGTNRQTGV
ncbi:hypothetical protein IQ06DRAFT_45525 [Phaeosphaeriaceae sp. SRC1lsM3a]|nr:hypothetical protein IQ06DRAFT_45525 [Stagonospora sp. SRC1lsM3a]